MQSGARQPDCVPMVGEEIHGWRVTEPALLRNDHAAGHSIASRYGTLIVVIDIFDDNSRARWSIVRTVLAITQGDGYERQSNGRI